MESSTKISTIVKDDIWCIRIIGELTRNEEETFFHTFPWLHPYDGNRCILFDMSQVHYLNSAGIALLIRFVREAKQRNYSCYAHSISSHYQKIFRIVGLMSYMELFPDEFTALETLHARRTFEK
ncbi:STAS domain-containing protein [Aneurinibacillus terranovensis]|uniref:STAS domain-containing protein n=1 Tax=Aneurinibacillus terranovensis TaxID=278991 RepID=UPI0004026A9C|nr:STAS domain-containing protein [Aneurinibacillus terranovensis]